MPPCNRKVCVLVNYSRAINIDYSFFVRNLSLTMSRTLSFLFCHTKGLAVYANVLS